MQLGEFAAKDDSTLRPPNGLDVGQCVNDAMRRFVENQRSRSGNIAGEVFERRESGTRLRRKKSNEGEKSVFRPEATSAVRAAFAPGIWNTGRPSAIAAWD